MKKILFVLAVVLPVVLLGCVSSQERTIKKSVRQYNAVVEKSGKSLMSSSWKKK